MTATLLLFPVVASMLLLFTKSRFLGLAAMVLHCGLTVAAAVYYLAVGGDNLLGYFVADGANSLFMTLIAVLYAIVTVSSVEYLRRSAVTPAHHRQYVIAMMMFTLSMTGAVLTPSVGLFWVFVEATTLASAALVYFERHDSSLEATWKYVFICSVGIAIAFIGILFLALSAKDVARLQWSALLEHAKDLNPYWLAFSFPFLLVGFGTKAGFAPMHSWLPDAHAEAPSPASAFLSGMLLNTAFFGLWKLFGIMVAAGMRDTAATLFLVCGFASLLISAVYIAGSTNYKRLLAYSSIENMGIALIGIAVGGPAVYAAFLHLAAHSLLKGGLFCTAGNILARYGTKDIAKVSGLLTTDPRNGVIWGLSFAALAGFPPSPIFISEFLIATQLAAQGRWWVFTAFVGLITLVLFGLARSVVAMCFGEPSKVKGPRNETFAAWLPQVAVLAFLPVLGFYLPTFIHDIIVAAANL